MTDVSGDTMRILNTSRNAESSLRFRSVIAFSRLVHTTLIVAREILKI